MAQKQSQKTKQQETQKQEQTQDLAQTVDYAFSLDREIKEKQEELKKLKATLKDQAEARQVKEIEGYESKVVFSDEEKTSVDPKTLYNFLLENGFGQENFFELVNVAVGPAKKALGEVLLDEVSETEFKEYAKSSLKKKKKEE